MLLKTVILFLSTSFSWRIFSVFGCCFFAIAWLHITEQTERTFTSKRRHNTYQYRHSVLADSQDWHCLRNLRPACQQKIWNQCSIEDSFRTGIDIMFPLSAKSVHIPEITVASPTETIWNPVPIRGNPQEDRLWKPSSQSTSVPSASPPNDGQRGMGVAVLALPPDCLSTLSGNQLLELL